MTATAIAFTEAFVDVEGFRIRFLEAGERIAQPLVWLHGGGGLHLSRAHELLAQRHRVIALEVPGFGNSAANERSQSYPELSSTMAHAAQALGLERFNLWGTSFGSIVALWWAIGAPENIDALVLEAPAAIVPEGSIRPSGSPEDLRRRLFAHPERQPLRQPSDPSVIAQMRALMARLPRPSRIETEARLAQLAVPTLVVFGTQDAVVPAAMGRIYREKMPNCNYVLVYDAGHEVGAERPEAFVSLVGDFLERRQAFIVNAKSSLLNP